MSLCLRLSLAVIMAASAVGCASTPDGRATRGDLESKVTRALSVYMDCAYIHADAMASGTGPGPEVAEAAVAGCERRQAEYCTLVTEYFESVASADEQDHARERAHARCAETREDLRASLTSRVLEERERAIQRLEREKEAGRDGSPPSR